MLHAIEAHDQLQTQLQLNPSGTKVPQTEEEDEIKNEFNEYSKENEETMIKLLKLLFPPLINVALLFQFIKTLTKTKINAKKLEKLIEFICSFKIKCFTSQEFQLKQIERTITISKNKYNASVQTFIQLPKNSNQKIFISRALTVLAIGSELIHFFMLKRKFLNEKKEIISTHLENLKESKEIQNCMPRFKFDT